ncbi:MAG: DUF523 domain-containing protein [Nitrospirae bacterium]|nr:MAG: DUF523 domain-containing protein [Nitrospirota bacterium]
MTKTAPLRIGISRCLLGEQVRHDGGHKRDDVLLKALSRHVEWVPVCPEVEVGMGTPREAIRLAGDPHSPRLVTVTTGVDHTEAMTRFSRQRARELEVLELSGYVFKARSPSCGIGGVPLLNTEGTETKDGIGLFARAFMEHFPLMPIEDEDRLHDPQAIKNFLDRAHAYRQTRNNIAQAGG